MIVFQALSLAELRSEDEGEQETELFLVDNLKIHLICRLSVDI